MYMYGMAVSEADGSDGQEDQQVRKASRRLHEPIPQQGKARRKARGLKAR